MNDNSSKRLAQILGITGLLPLLIADVVTLNFLPKSVLSQSGLIHLLIKQLAPLKDYSLIAVSLGNIYAAIILSFLGAIHWGLALDRSQSADKTGPLLLWSVIPALWGFFALWWSPLLATLLLMLGFVAQWLADLRLQRQGFPWPSWFFSLRSGLTLGILLLLGVLAAEIYAMLQS
jgi:hypothetical protein